MLRVHTLFLLLLLLLLLPTSLQKPKELNQREQTAAELLQALSRLLLHLRDQQARGNAALVFQCAHRCKEARSEHIRLRLLRVAGVTAPEAQDPITFSHTGASGRGWARGAQRLESAAANNWNPLLPVVSLGVPPRPKLQPSPPFAGASGNQFIRRPSASSASSLRPVCVFGGVGG